MELILGDCLEEMKSIPDKSIDMILCDLPYGTTVLDNCMGSGTTGIACKNLNRNFVGIEIEEAYFNVAKERIGKC